MSNAETIAGLPLEEEVARFMSAAHPDRVAIRHNPYPFYDRLRSHAPVYKTAIGPWLVTSHDLVDELVRAPHWRRETDVAESALSLGERVVLRSLVFRDPPAHTRLRRILSPLFTISAIEKRRQRTRAVAKERSDDAQSSSVVSIDAPVIHGLPAMETN